MHALLFEMHRQRCGPRHVVLRDIPLRILLLLSRRRQIQDEKTDVVFVSLSEAYILHAR